MTAINPFLGRRRVWKADGKVRVGLLGRVWCMGQLYGKCVQWLPRVGSNLSDCSNHAGYRCKECGVQSALENSYLNYSRLNCVWQSFRNTDSFVHTTSGQHSQVRFDSLTAHLCAHDSFFPKHHFSFTSSLFFSLFPRTPVSSLRWFTFLCVQSLGSQQRNGLVLGYFEKKKFFFFLSEEIPVQL